MAGKKKAQKGKGQQGERKASHPLMVNEKDWNRDVVMDYVCDQLATSSKGLGTILKAGYGGEALPTYSTLMKWLGESADLSDRYARAKEAQADYLADEMLDIADDARNDWMERTGSDGESAYTLNGEHVQRSKLRIESRKWLMGKLKPKKYGEKVTQEHTGEGGGPVDHSITVSFVNGKG